MSQPPTSPRAPGHARGLSFRSDRSGGSKTKEDLIESPSEKARRDNIWSSGSKANPNAALQEAQPGDLARLEESTIASLRAVQHRDTNGNIITDPDLSNPTRPRMERPLDTIRSFEKAIDNGYKRRSSYNRSESYDQNSQQYPNSRRGSYYGGNDTQQPSNYRPSPNGGGYYNQQQQQQPPPPSNGPRARYSRMQSDPSFAGRSYPQHAHQPSQETMHTSSDSTGPWAGTTDPSSENSSAYQQGMIPEEGGAYPSPYPRGGAPPSARRPIQLGAGSLGDAPLPPPSKLPTTPRPEPEKRKSWLKRTFSKKE